MQSASLYHFATHSRHWSIAPQTSLIPVSTGTLESSRSIHRVSQSPLCDFRALPLWAIQPGVLDYRPLNLIHLGQVLALSFFFFSSGMTLGKLFKFPEV